MNLSFRQLNTFREVIRAGSISQAARVLGRTQPAVSSMVAGLEAELGFALFLREHGKLTPTPEARYFLEECEDILARLEQTKRTLGGIARLEKGKLRIASHPAASGFFTPRVLTEFLRDKPGVDASLMMRSSGVIEDLIASQQFDVGFAETPKARSSIGQQDFDLECLCAMPRDDKLADHELITPETLRGADLAMLFEEHQTHVQTRAAFEEMNCAYRWRFELQTFLPGLKLVEAGLCYMICDLITAQSNLDRGDTGLVFRRFRPRIGSSVSILTPAHSPQSRLSQAFCKRLEAEIRTVQQNVEAFVKTA
ncbi:HTH-type transcriptional regulator CynR [Roseovarius litorisediminis]|uniref:HTH-type transcriptional regulator CynR n=1 Tax=Roseovarius litorisediminis TaxID=1312363 RepID=A0A1Y5RAF2_9RHOB|nr:LysR family transcriptional regulator [Roseovarius litorisediminis]SLN12870.1 HTH-type transcriptional regulator CynR [Roseovarius litorisediminis]